tara:strand:- start:2287 stop:3033 length:747 start_codon:yes stop_codon:yes gene_type:complete
MEYSVILPTLNENGHIADLIKSIEDIFKRKKINYEIIIIDDNSTDGTINTVKNLTKFNKFLKLCVRSNLKKNLAESINKGIEMSKYENIIWMDADFQHPPKYIEKFINESTKYDAIIASRFLRESNRYFNTDKLKKKINENQSYFYNKICRYIFFNDITDYTSGFICIKKDFFKNYSLKGFYGDYFVELIIRLKKKKYRIIEIPFRDSIRASGSSKTLVTINFKYLYTCFRYFLTLLKSYLKYKLNFY